MLPAGNVPGADPGIRSTIGPSDEALQTRYEELREDFLDEYRQARDILDAQVLDPVIRRYDRAQKAVRDNGDYLSGIQTLRQAMELLGRLMSTGQAAGGKTSISAGEELQEIAERQYDRLKRVLEDTQDLVRSMGSTEAISPLLERAYTEADRARGEMRDGQWDRALVSIQRATELAQDANRAVQAGALETGADNGEKVRSALENMESVLTEARDTASGEANTVLAQAEEFARSARAASGQGQHRRALELSYRAMALGRLAIRQVQGDDQEGLSTLSEEIERLDTLIHEAQGLLEGKDAPVARTLLQRAVALRDQAGQKETGDAGNTLSQNRLLIRQAMEQVAKAIALLRPDENLDASAQLERFQTRYLSQARQMLRENPNPQAMDKLTQAESLAVRARSQIEAGTPRAALTSLRAATELAIQAIRIAGAGQHGGPGSSQ